MLCMELCACSHSSDKMVLIGQEDNVTLNSQEEMVPVRETEKVADLLEESTPIKVYVCGAVELPGVVEVSADSRVEDVLEAVGGFTESADATSVNLAAWVSDGQMLYIPTKEEEYTGQGEWSGTQVPGISSAGTSSEGLVNINTADVAQLCTLPGIGEKRANDIITYREENGFFQTCEDIMCVPGIKSGLYEEICDRITVK